MNQERKISLLYLQDLNDPTANLRTRISSVPNAHLRGIVWKQ